MKLKIPTDFDIQRIENYRSILFISCLLLFLPCGLRLNVFPFITYIFYFPALLIILYIIIRTYKIIITTPILCGLAVIIYLWITQLRMGNVELIGIFTKTATISFCVIGMLMFPRLSEKKVFYICDIMMLTCLLFHGFDTLCRLIIIKFNFIRMFTDIYSTKDTTFVAADTNVSGFITLVLTFLAYYLYSITKKNKYKFFMVAFYILTILSCSRSSWLALGVTTVFIIISLLVQDVFKKRKKKSFYVIPIKIILLTIIFFVILWVVYNIVIYVQLYLSSDGSFGTKLKLYHDTANFLHNAPKQHLLFGAGFNNGRLYTGGLHSHTFFSTFIMETGIYGTSLMMLFFLSVFLHARKTILVLMPFFVCSLGFAYLSALFYASLGIIDYFENYYVKKMSEEKI